MNIIKKIWMPLFLIVSLIFIGQYFYNQTDRLKEILHPAPRFLVIAFVFQLIYWFLTVGCWQRIVGMSARKRIGFIEGFSHLALVTLGKYFPGKIWGMVARASLMKQQGVAIHQSVLATVSEQYLLLHASALLSVILLCVIKPSFLTFALCVVAAGSVIMVEPLQRFAFRLLARLTMKSWRRELQETSPLSFWQSLGLLAAYGMVWLFVGMIFSCIYFSLFPVTPTVLIVARLVLANTIGITLGFFALFSPGGIGVREAVTSALLVSLLSLEDALLLSLVFRLWIVISEVLSGIALLVPHKAQEGGEQL